MVDSKYGKYIVYDAKLPILKGVPPPQPRTGEWTDAMVLHVDNTVVEGAFYLNCAPSITYSKDLPE